MGEKFHDRQLELELDHCFVGDRVEVVKVVALLLLNLNAEVSDRLRELGLPDRVELDLLDLHLFLRKLILCMGSSIVDLQSCRVGVLLAADSADVLAILLDVLQILTLRAFVLKLLVALKVEGAG